MKYQIRKSKDKKFACLWAFSSPTIPYNFTDIQESNKEFLLGHFSFGLCKEKPRLATCVM